MKIKPIEGVMKPAPQSVVCCKNSQVIIFPDHEAEE